VRRIRITLEYDGAEFAGWQTQPDARSVQGELQAALERVTGAATRVTGAGRTDAGVHARGQVAHFDTASRLADRELARALNAVLPRDVAILQLRPVSSDFHARYHALSKRYRYRLLAGRPRSPTRRRDLWEVRQRLNRTAMARAAALLEGTHDFGAFRGAPGGAPERERTERTLERLSVDRVRDEIQVVAEARSFLRYMVRNLVGSLVEVGAGRLPEGAVAEILASRDRSRAGPTAPAHGLCLEWVQYGSEDGARGPADEAGGTAAAAEASTDG
jgi:tRNA pseudouridine38-40 synthase